MLPLGKEKHGIKNLCIDVPIIFIIHVNSVPFPCYGTSTLNFIVNLTFKKKVGKMKAATATTWKMIPIIVLVENLNFEPPPPT